ncbi:MAG: DinB family protein [Coriobacteriia bacterium]
MSGDSKALVEELRRSMSGQTWFGPPLAELIADVDATAASRHVTGTSHSIWEIVSHLGVWARYAAYRFRGGVPRELDEENWPPIPCADEQAWATACEALFAAYDEAADALSILPAERLDAVDPTTPVDQDGEPVTLRRVAAGLAQHAAYHAGQIAVIKRLSADESAPA